jgi:hypothetical protein
MNRGRRRKGRWIRSLAPKNSAPFLTIATDFGLVALLTSRAPEFFARQNDRNAQRFGGLIQACSGGLLCAIRLQSALRHPCSRDIVGAE